MNTTNESFVFDKEYVIEQNVDGVMEKSSFYGDSSRLSFIKNLVIGQPEVYLEESNINSFPNAFILNHYGNWWKQCPSKTEEFMTRSSSSKIISDDFLVVYYETAVYPISMRLYEIRNVGAVVRVWAQQPGSNWILLWEGEPENRDAGPILTPRVIHTNYTSYKTNVFRLEFNQRNHDYHTEFATVTLTGSTRPPKVLTTKVPPVGSDSCPSVLVEGQSSQREFFEYLEVFRNIYIRGTPKTLPVAESSNEDFQEHVLNLSDEIIFNIFTYLDLKSLRRCRSVCHKFKAIASDSLLYKELNLKPFWYCMNGEALKSLAPSCNMLTKLDASWCGQSKLLVDDFVRFLDEVGQNLTHLRLNSASFVTDKVLIRIAKICRNLKELELRHCASTWEIGYKALSELEKLERLDLHDVRITSLQFVSIIAANPNLKHLNFTHDGRMNGEMDEILMQIADSNKQLVSLNLWNCTALLPQHLIHIGKMKNLEELELSWCKKIRLPGQHLLSIASGCPKLRKLFLTALDGIVDLDLKPFVKSCPLLEQLSFFGLKLITENIVYQFLTTCSKLKYLDLNFCSEISNEQIEMWREIYPEVSIKSCMTGRELTPDLDHS